MKTKIENIQKQMNTIDNVLRETEIGKEESFKIKKNTEKGFKIFLRKRQL